MTDVWTRLDRLLPAVEVGSLERFHVGDRVVIDDGHNLWFGMAVGVEPGWVNVSAGTFSGSYPESMIYLDTENAIQVGDTVEVCSNPYSTAKVVEIHEPENGEVYVSVERAGAYTSVYLLSHLKPVSRPKERL